jgi:hypothetical protein
MTVMAAIISPAMAMSVGVTFTINPPARRGLSFLHIIHTHRQPSMAGVKYTFEVFARHT